MLSLLSFAAPVLGAGGDFTINWIAAAPFSYHASVGGGAFDDRTIGRNKDVVESLQGGDFICGDHVTFFAVIDAEESGDFPQAIEMDLSFLADSTGQSGVAFVAIDEASVGVNGGKIGGKIVDIIDGEDALDQGNRNIDGVTAEVVPGSTKILVSKQSEKEGVAFKKDAVLVTKVAVKGLRANSRTVVRLDGMLGCNGEKPTGNLQGYLDSARVTETTAGVVNDKINTGNQNIPLKLDGKEGSICIPDALEEATNGGAEPLTCVPCSAVAEDCVKCVLRQARDGCISCVDQEEIGSFCCYPEGEEGCIMEEGQNCVSQAQCDTRNALSDSCTQPRIECTEDQQTCGVETCGNGIQETCKTCLPVTDCEPAETVEVVPDESCPQREPFFYAPNGQGRLKKTAAATGGGVAALGAMGLYIRSKKKRKPALTVNLDDSQRIEEDAEQGVKFEHA